MAAETRSKGVVRIASIAGVEIEIDYSWLFIFALVLWSLSAGYFPYEYPGYTWRAYWLVGFVATILFFASVLIHELSHAAVANRLGEDVRKITLFIFGGMAHLSGEPRSASVEFQVAAAGPVTSIGLAMIFWFVDLGLPHAPEFQLWSAMFRYLAFINLALALFNLLPGYPLDGGRLLRAYLWWRDGNMRSATERAADWGRGIAVGLIVLGVLQIFSGSLVGGLWLVFIGLFLRSAATTSYQGLIIQQALGGSRVADIMVREPVVLDPELSVERAIEDYFLRLGYTGFPVVSDGRLGGMLSLAQVRDCPPEERMRRRVRDIMRPAEPGLEITETASVGEALKQMGEKDVGRLVVVK
ncbi:MAG: site-2 protease family protein, partial [Candidatus Binataceae bacterium]